MKDSAAAEKGAGKARKSHHGTEPPIAKKRTLAARKAKILGRVKKMFLFALAFSSEIYIPNMIISQGES